MKKIILKLILILVTTTIFFISKEVYASTENYMHIKDGKLYLAVSEVNKTSKDNDNNLEGNCEIVLEEPSKGLDVFLEGVSCAVNKSSAVVSKKYFVVDLLRSKFKNLNLQKMDLRGLEISDENLQNNNFENSIMDAKTRERFLRLKFNFDRKILEDDSSLATLLNSPSLTSASNSLLLEFIIQEYFKTHKLSQLNSLLEKVASEDTHLLFKREGLEKSAHSYDDYLQLMIPVNIEGQKKPKESYVEKLKSFVDETKDLILDKSETEKFESDWEKKYRDYGNEGNKVLALGYEHTCALKNDGTVFCWGRDSENQTASPEGLKDVKSIALGLLHSCALKNGGTVVCWGYNNDGQINTPADLKDVKGISLGGGHTCALKNNKSVVCWGEDSLGQSTPPVGLKDVKSIALGNSHSCALKNNGTVVCWGNTNEGQLTVPSDLKDVKSIALGGDQSCALKNNGTVVCWGKDYFNQSTPPADLDDVKSIALGGADNHSCALKNDGTVVCWGPNNFGESAPPPGLKDVKSIALGAWHSCAVKNDGTVVCWGDKQRRQSIVPENLIVKID
ncbi:MAG: hypothetical protein HQK49_10710 [Oligoflexia bacterium]|nr:hypothetical protein [Oligoflexia bacterium]